MSDRSVDSAARPTPWADAVEAVAAALYESQHGGCGTTSLRHRKNPTLQAETAIRTLLSLGWQPPKGADE